MDPIVIFLDSDVIVAALLSKKGASSEIIKNNEFTKFASKTIKKEVEEVVKRLPIDITDNKLFETIHIITLDINRGRLAKKYFAYVSDLEDSHVVAGAERSKSSFLLTHNLKHYKTDLIEQKLKIVVLNPGQFLQYLRSKFLS